MCGAPVNSAINAQNTNIDVFILPLITRRRRPKLQIPWAPFKANCAGFFSGVSTTDYPRALHRCQHKWLAPRNGKSGRKDLTFLQRFFLAYVPGSLTEGRPVALIVTSSPPVALSPAASAFSSSVPRQKITRSENLRSLRIMPASSKST